MAAGAAELEVGEEGGVEGEADGARGVGLAEERSQLVLGCGVDEHPQHSLGMVRASAPDELDRRNGSRRR